MGVKESIQTLNESSRKGAKITLIIVLAIVLFSAFCVIFFTLNHNRNIESARLFEAVYVDINEFDELNSISKVEMKDDLIYDLDQILLKYANTTAGKRALFYKGHVNYYTGDYKEAESIFAYFTQKYKNLYLTEKAYYFLSYAQYKQGNLDGAIETLKVFDDKLKESYYAPLALYQLGSLYEEKKDKDSAIQYYEKIVAQWEDSSQKNNAEKKLVLLKNDLEL